MDQLLALVVVVPLLAAAAVTAFGPLLRSRRRLLDVAAILAAACVAVMLGVIMIRTAGGDQVYWFAGFRPAHGVSIGIDFEAQPLSAGLACLAAVLVTAAMTFSWRYFERVATYFHALMLTFLAGIVGFCLTGDLFDLFVWFELMGVSAYALTAYRPEERGPIQGALNFAITNSVGAYLSLSGIALIYGRTGALNMAQIGRSIAKHPADRLVVVAFVLVIAGLLIKSAIVPFHFWLADAHAVAPTPVCVLFSGVMVELGLYGIARVYWSVFGQALGHRAAISHVFLGPRPADRRDRGVVLLPRAAHQADARVLHHQPRRHVPDRYRAAHPARPGRRRRLRHRPRAGQGQRCSCAPGSCCTGSARSTSRGCTAAAARCGSPEWCSPWPGSGWLTCRRSPRSSARAGSRPARCAWLIPILIVCSSLVGGAVLRVAGGVFYGLGDRPAEDPQMAREAAEETSETAGGKDRTPLTMIVPPAILVVAAIVVGLIGQLGPAVQAAAVRFEDQAGYNATVLDGAHITHPVALFAAGPTSVTAADVLAGPRLGRRGADPGRAGAVLAAAAAAARLPAERPARRSRPPLPERRGERLRDLDRHRPGLPRRCLRPGHPLTQWPRTAAGWFGAACAGSRGQESAAQGEN